MMVPEENPRDHWDCESVLSIRSNVSNHPRKISEPMRVKAGSTAGTQANSLSSAIAGIIKLSAKTGLPSTVLPNGSAAAGDEDEEMGSAEGSDEEMTFNEVGGLRWRDARPLLAQQDPATNGLGGAVGGGTAVCYVRCWSVVHVFLRRQACYVGLASLRVRYSKQRAVKPFLPKLASLTCCRCCCHWRAGRCAAQGRDCGGAQGAQGCGEGGAAAGAQQQEGSEADVQERGHQAEEAGSRDQQPHRGAHRLMGGCAAGAVFEFESC